MPMLPITERRRVIEGILFVLLKKPVIKIDWFPYQESIRTCVGHGLQCIRPQNAFSRLFRTEFHQAAGKILVETEQKSFDLDVLRAMAGLLIERGADTNQEQNYPIPGYTPLMLAIESDELDLVKRMISAGGLLEKTYLDQNSSKWVMPLQIATEFQANSVLNEVFGKG